MSVTEKIEGSHGPDGWNFSFGQRRLWGTGKDNCWTVADWDTTNCIVLKGKKLGQHINRKVFTSLENAFDYMIQRP